MHEKEVAPVVTRQTPEFIAASFALCGFALATVAGHVAGQPLVRVLVVAVLAMFLCRLVGVWAGRAAMVAVDEFLEKYAGDRPVPEQETFEESLEVSEDDAPLASPVSLGRSSQSDRLAA